MIKEIQENRLGLVRVCSRWFHSILRHVVHGRSLITDGKDYGF